MEFNWDASKATINEAKHGVSFDEAATAFDDPLFLAFADPDHSNAEQRFILLAQSNQKHLLVVSYTERGPGIRLISARLATRSERKTYEEKL